jgi:O-antigen ligase
MEKPAVNLQQTRPLDSPRQDHRLTETVLAVFVGIAVGTSLVISRSLPPKWAAALLLALVSVVFVLLLGDIKKVILIALVIDIPLEFDVAIQNHGSHQGDPTGYLISLMTIALVVGYTVWIADRSRDRVHSHRSMTTPLVVFVFTAVLSIFQSASATFSMFSVFLLAQVFLMYFYVVNHVRTWRDVDLIIFAWAGCIAFEALVMIFTYVTGIEFSFAGIGNRSSFSGGTFLGRVGGTFGSVNDAAIWLTPSLVVLMGAYLTYNELRLPGRQFLLGVSAVGVIGLVLTFSRSGWAALALAVSVLVCLCALGGHARKSLTVLIFIGLIATAVFAKPIVERLTGDDGGSAASRRVFEAMALNMIADQPLFGIGINNFELRMFEYLPVELLGELRQYIYVVHNHYLMVWAELGIPGLTAFLWALLAAAGQGVRWLTQRGSGARRFVFTASLLSALVGYALHMKTDVFASRMPVQLLWFVFALITAVGNLRHTEANTNSKRELEAVSIS